MGHKTFSVLQFVSLMPFFILGELGFGVLLGFFLPEKLRPRSLTVQGKR